MNFPSASHSKPTENTNLTLNEGVLLLPSHTSTLKVGLPPKWEIVGQGHDQDGGVAVDSRLSLTLDRLTFRKTTTF